MHDMAEEHKEHGLERGQHADHAKSTDKDKALYWGLGLSAVGVVIALLLFSGGGSKKKSSSTPTVVNASQPFIPNPTDVSIGSMANIMYWPGLATSGTATHPKTHHHGDKKEDEKKSTGHHTTTTKSNDKKGYGKSPTGATHGHHVSTHNVHNPKTVATKGHG